MNMHAPRKNPGVLRALRILLLVSAALGVMGFDGCNDDPLLDSEGGSGCAGSYCTARTLPDSTPNPARF
jgi:hypothetical protein